MLLQALSKSSSSSGGGPGCLSAATPSAAIALRACSSAAPYSAAIAPRACSSSVHLRCCKSCLAVFFCNVDGLIAVQQMLVMRAMRTAALPRACANLLELFGWVQARC